LSTKCGACAAADGKSHFTSGGLRSASVSGR
jgi:hypothetical protein